MMQTYCKYTSLPLTGETLTNGLGIKGKDLIVAGEHPLFSKPLSLALSAASFKPVLSLSPEQRYLLSVVLLKGTGLFTIRHPITMAQLPDSTTKKILPVLIAATSRICAAQKEWKEISSLLPRMEYRADNHHGFSWEYLAKQCILKHTDFLSFPNPKAKAQAAVTNPYIVEESLESEHTLFHTMQGTIAKNKALTFNIGHIKTAINLMSEAMNAAGSILSAETSSRILSIFITPPAKLTIRASEVITIKRALVHWLEGTIEETSILYRQAYHLSIKQIDWVIGELSNKATMFDDIEVKELKQSPSFKIEQSESNDINATTVPAPASFTPSITQEELSRLQRVSPALANLAKRKLEAERLAYESAMAAMESSEVTYEKITDTF